MHAPFPEQQRKARAELKTLFATPAVLRVIHYSCESLDNRPDGRSPRITSIAVKHMDSGQARSFSIHRVAEERGVSLDAIERQYDELEQEMLAEFYRYVGEHGEAHYMHWNMRDANYGFEAIEHRARVLHTEPRQIPEDRRHDVSNLMQAIYGPDYIDHPRLLTLATKNDITLKDSLTGQQEAEEFDDKRYVSLHQSTLRKVDVIAAIAERANHRTLKSNANLWVRNGGSLRSLWFAIAENKTIAALGLIFCIVLGIAAVLFGYQALHPLVAPGH